MANAPQTTGELFKAQVVTDADIAAAVDAFMDDPSTSAFLFSEGYRIDLAEAVRAHEWASVTTSNEKATDHLKRAAVRKAILLARPEKV
ncbi:hypothetical protein FV218_12480 [Methylobacterium sp. WL69]|jgi:hypothetical protein|uniref:hypothetical protein n=1 Tax=Methylobacterium sp. WL69 TaxID=2603893 RepID=UPI0011C9F60C|nr:hypothetical protein [Methylobacterium sp. WL69]TXM72815.1 hypothetical protein FV218_12480 [Methylobacterium sp. WL69]